MFFLNIYWVDSSLLCSQVAAALGKLLSTSIRILNVEGIGLGSSGFQELQDGITKELKLVKVNIRCERITLYFFSTFFIIYLYTLIADGQEIYRINKLCVAKIVEELKLQTFCQSSYQWLQNSLQSMPHIILCL